MMHGQSLPGFISDLLGIGAIGMVGAFIVVAPFVVVGAIVWWLA